jgi:hypothetical protein
MCDAAGDTDVRTHDPANLSVSKSRAVQRYRQHERRRELRLPSAVIFVLARAVTYSTLFIGFLLVYLPSRIPSSVGINQPDAIHIWQVAGMVSRSFIFVLQTIRTMRRPLNGGCATRQSTTFTGGLPIRRTGWL